MENFKKLGIGKALLETIGELKFTHPTPIQEKAIPLVYQGRDVIGQAATGSGKTLAFGSAIIEKVKPEQGTQALILVPTRELAEQVSQSMKRFSRNYDLAITEVYGGVSINPQIRTIQKAEIIIGTPGRILDHLERRTLDLSKISFLVLDEADRMADMGFLPDVRKIIENCGKDRQTMLFTATISQDMEYISRHYMINPITVNVESYVPTSKLKQVYFDVRDNEKFSLFVHLLKKEHSGLIMVFCNTRRNVNTLVYNLKRFGFEATAIHGGLNQNKRNQVIRAFHEEKVAILICTDVAARGLDIKNVSHVYNYDIPKDSTDYIHRIGRTARAGKEGEAISLVSQRDYENFRKVLLDDSLSLEQQALPEFEKLVPRFAEERRGGFQRGRQGNFRGRERFGSRGRFVRRDRDNFRSRDNRNQGGFKDRGHFRFKSREETTRREKFEGRGFNRPRGFHDRTDQRTRGYFRGERFSRNLRRRF